jgi:hypothetical protein
MQAFIRPMLFASLALHALVLLIPAPPQETPEPIEEEQITLTQLPPVEQPTEQPSPQPSPPPVSQRRNTRTPASVRRDAPPATQPSPRSETNRGQSAENVASQNQAANQNQADNQSVDPFAADFPIYPGSEVGSFGLPEDYDGFSRRTTDGLGEVDSWFQRELAAKDFTLQEIETNSTGKVYQVSKGGATQFLILVSDPSGTGRTNYILSPQQLRLEDLADANIASPEEVEFFRNLSDILPTVDTERWQEVTPQFDLAEPTAFYSDLGSLDTDPVRQEGVESALVEVDSAPQAVFNRLNVGFDGFEITVSDRGSYGGGSFYELSRTTNNVTVTRYLSLVPTNSGGTAIFLWSSSPI